MQLTNSRRFLTHNSPACQLANMFVIVPWYSGNKHQAVGNIIKILHFDRITHWGRREASHIDVVVPEKHFVYVQNLDWNK